MSALAAPLVCCEKASKQLAVRLHYCLLPGTWVSIGVSSIVVPAGMLDEEAMPQEADVTPALTALVTLLKPL